MTNRKKRLERGIESLKEQIKTHKEKLKKAVEEENEELAGYYEKDIVILEREEIKKEKQLNKK